MALQYYVRRTTVIGGALKHLTRSSSTGLVTWGDPHQEVTERYIVFPRLYALLVLHAFNSPTNADSTYTYSLVPAEM